MKGYISLAIGCQDLRELKGEMTNRVLLRRKREKAPRLTSLIGIEATKGPRTP
jgi:hypothetical protein